MNIKNIRSKVKKAITSANFSVHILRDIEIDDGIGGVIVAEEGAFQYELPCVIDNSKSIQKNKELTEYKGVVVDKSPILVCLYDETKMPKEGDYFILNDKKYIITYIDDVLHLNIYLQCSLKVVPYHESRI